jgi:superfamily II DNA or RNA helicase
VEKATTYRYRENKGGKTKFTYRSLFQADHDEGYIESFAGLRKRIERELKTIGYSVSFERLHEKFLVSDLERLSDDDLANLDDRGDQVDVLGLIVDHPDGFIVDAPTGWGKSYVVRQICQILPKHRIAVVAPGKDVVRMLHKGLKQKIRDVGLVGDSSNMIERITVSTMEGVPKLRKYDWDLLLFDEVHRAGGPSIANNIAEVFCNAKCVGFSASPIGRSDGADLVVEALFGPVLYKVSYQEGVDRGAVAPIHVKMYKIETGSPVMTTHPSGRVPPVERNRHGLWRNKDRNELIARIANEFPKEDQRLIIVNTAEHALYLHNLLPDYTVVFSNLTNKKVLKRIYDGEFDMVEGVDKNGKMHDGYRAKMQNDFESGKLTHAIATGVWATGVDFTKLKWLIRGDGMASPIQAIQTPGRLSRTSEGKVVGTLIDFIDAFDPGLLRRSQTRMLGYNKNDWKIDIIEDPAVTLDRFSMRRK